jgi:hypothetical protein
VLDYERWLDHVFFAGLEISTLSIPALLVLLAATPRGPVSLAALTAIVVSTCAAGTFRGGWVDLGGRVTADEWPAPGDLYTMPFRSAYYSATIAGGAYLGAGAQVVSGSPALGMAVSTLVSIAAMAALPRAVGGVRSLADRLVSVGI